MNPALERRCLLRNRLGLHVRTAGLLAHTASRFQSRIRVAHNGREVDAEDIMELLMLAAGRGSTLHLHAAGPDAEQALESLEELISTRFGEQP